MTFLIYNGKAALVLPFGLIIMYYHFRIEIIACEISREVTEVTGNLKIIFHFNKTQTKINRLRLIHTVRIEFNFEYSALYI